MVYPKLSAVVAAFCSKCKPDKGSWVYVAQAFIGSFFLMAALYKLNNYFITADQSLSNHFQFWIDNGWPAKWFEHLMISIGQPNHKLIAVGVILGQAIPGILFIINKHVRKAAVLLIILQSMVFIGTIHQTNFNEFVGISIWVCLFYILKPRLPENIAHVEWQLLTIALLCLIILQLFNRYMFYSDHLLSSVVLHREHLAADVSSIYPPIKEFVLWITQFPYMNYVWASTWYIHILLALLILTRFRLQAQSVNLVIWILNEIIWTNGITSQGALWVLVLFIYVTMEQYLQFRHPDFKHSSILGSAWIEVKRFALASW